MEQKIAQNVSQKDDLLGYFTKDNQSLVAYSTALDNAIEIYDVEKKSTLTSFRGIQLTQPSDNGKYDNPSSFYPIHIRK